MANNTGFISKLGAETQLVDGTDAIHTGIIKTLNVAMGQNRLISTAVITQGTTSSYTHYEIEKTDGGDNALTAIRDGMVVSVPNKTITTNNPAIAANALGDKDWYGLIVIADGTESGETLNNLYFREGAVTGKANTSTATVAELKSGDIPIALIKYTAGSANNATNRDVQWLTGNVQTSRGFSAINGGSETFKINPTGTISYGSATITLPSSTGTLARTADITSSIAAISTGNNGLVPSAGNAGEFLKHDGTFGTPSYIANTNTQNVFTSSFVDSTDDILLRLTKSGASSGTQDIKFVAGSNVTLTHTDANNITIASTDTNTQLSLIDSDTMTGASATNVASAESVKAYVDNQVSGLVSSAPTALDTLNELAAALGDDANFATTTSTALGNRLRIDTASQNLTSTQKSNAITNLGLGAAATLGTAAIADGGTALATADQIHTFVTGQGYTTDSQISTEAVQDIVGAMFTSNTETRVGATYDDTSGKIDIVVDDMTADTNKFLSGLSLSGGTITATVTGGTNQTLDISAINTNTNIGTTDIISGLTALSSIDIANDSLIFRDNSDSGAVKKLSLTELMAAVTEAILPDLSAAKITSGEFATGRIPTLAQSKITDLTTDLAAKVPTSRTIAGKALSNNLTLAVNAAGKLEINDGGTAVIIQNASNADVIFDNSKITTATLGLDNVTNVSQATIQAATLTAATASDVGLGNVDNKSAATLQSEILTAATASDVGLGSAASDITTNATNIATNTTNIATNSTKLGFLTVTQAVDLDTMESDITTNATNIATNASNIFGGAFSNLTSTPTTLAGYGITDALAGNTTVNDVSVANLLARAGDLTTAQATTFRTSIGAGSATDNNDFINAASFASGTLTLTSNNNTISDVTVDISGVNTDTTYSAATTSAAGLMSTAHFDILDSVTTIGAKIVATTTPSNNSSGFLKLAAASDGTLSTSLDTNTYLTSVATANITDNAVTFAKLQDIGSSGANSLILGRNIADVGGASAISAPMLGVITAANQSAALSAIGADASGTDNSTDVTLVTSSYDYLSISGQEITLEQIDASADISGLATVATSGSYTDLINIPTTFAPTLGNTSTTALAGDTAVLLDSDFTSSGFMKTNGSGTYSIDSNTYITSQRAISDTPTDGDTTTAISSAWAYDNVKTAVPTSAVFTDSNVSSANLKTVLADFGAETVTIGDANTNVTIVGDLKVTGDTFYSNETIKVVEDNTIAFRNSDTDGTGVIKLTAANPSASGTDNTTYTVTIPAADFIIPTSDTVPNATNVTSSLVAASSISSTDKTAILSNIGAGTSSFGGAFSDLTSKPTTIAGYGITDAFDGAYSSLSGLPTLLTLGTTSTTALRGDTSLFSGSYDDLSNKPTLLTLGTTSSTALAGDTSLFSGNYADLTNKPTLLTLGTSSSTALAGDTSLFSGSYADLTNKPTLLTIGTTSSTALAGDTTVDNVTNANLRTALSNLESASGIDTDETLYIGADAGDKIHLRGALSVAGDVIFGGSATDLEVNDNLILIGKKDADVNTTGGGSLSSHYGIEVEAGKAGTNNIVHKSLRYNTSSSRWEFTNNGSDFFNLPLSSEYGTGLSGSVDVVTSGNIPVATDFARFTDADTLEGLTAAQVRSALDLEIGTDVQAYDLDLTTLAGLSKTDGGFIVGSGSSWTVETTSTARTSLGAAASGNITASDLTIISGGTDYLTFAGNTDATSAGIETIRINADTTNSGNSNFSGSGLRITSVGGNKFLSLNTVLTDIIDATTPIDDVSVANLKDRLNDGFGGDTVQIGDANDTITIAGNLVVTGTTKYSDETIQIVEDNTLAFRAGDGNAHEVLLTADNPTSGDVTITLPVSAGNFTIPTQDTTYSVGDGGLTQNNFTNALKSKVDFITVTQAVDLDTMESNIATNNSKNTNVVGDLAAVANGTSLTITTTNGNNVSLPLADTDSWGVMSDEMFDKLDGIATSANNYSLPTASSIVLGGIKVGSNLTISSGVLSGTPDTVYTHPTHDGDDISIDTSGANVIDTLTITTNTLGHVTDASATTRVLSLSDLGFTGDADATDDLTAAEIRTLVGTGNGGVLPSAGTSGHFLKHDGTFGALPAKMAFTVRDSSDTDVIIGDARFIKFNEGNGLDITFTDTDTGDTNDPYDLTFKVADNGIGADQLNVSGNGTSGNALLSDGDGSFSWGTAGDATLAGTQTFSGAKTFTSDVNLDGAGLNINKQYSRINFKKDATNNAVNNAAIFFYNASDSIRGGINYMYSLDRLGFNAGADYQLYITDGAIYPPVDNDVDLGTSSLKFKDSFFGLVDAENFKVNGGQGSDGQVLTSTGSGVAWEDAAGGSVGGSDTELLYNDGGTENGIASLTWTDTAGSEQLLLSDASDTSLFKIIQTGTGDALEVHDEASDTTVFKVDQSGHVQIGTTSETIGALRVKGYQGTSSVSSVSTYRISRLEDGVTGSLEITSSQSDGDMYVGAGSAGADLIFHTRRSSPSVANYENIRLTSNGEIGIEGSNFGSSGQVLTSGGSGAAVSWSTISGGASAIGDLSDAITTATNNIGLGSGALDSLTASSGNYNVALGINAGTAITTGDRNISIGYGAADGFDTESDNIAIGYDALGGAVAGGEKNVSIGNYSGDALTSGDYNVFVGHKAGTGVTTGQANVIVGNQEFTSSTMTGSYNVHVGQRAGEDTTDGTYNTFVGASSGQNVTSGDYNTVLGRSALFRADTQAGNVALGYKAGYQAKGANNISIGYLSGQQSGTSGTGSNNILLGVSAGDNITDGSNNVVIGAADVPSATGSDQLSISSGDGGTTWIQGNSDGIVLGALTPLFYERAALDTTAVDFRVPTVQSSTANPNGYPMPFAGTVRAASFLFAGSAISTSGNTNTIRIRKNGGTSGSNIKDFTFTESDLVNTNGFQYTLVKSGSDVLFTFAAGDVLQLKRQSGSTDLNNSQALLWVSYNF